MLLLRASRTRALLLPVLAAETSGRLAEQLFTGGNERTHKCSTPSAIVAGPQRPSRRQRRRTTRWSVIFAIRRPRAIPNGVSASFRSASVPGTSMCRRSATATTKTAARSSSPITRQADRRLPRSWPQGRELSCYAPARTLQRAIGALPPSNWLQTSAYPSPISRHRHARQRHRSDFFRASGSRQRNGKRRKELVEEEYPF